MFCQQCGSQIDDGVAFCPKCGKATRVQNVGTDQTQQQPVANQAGYQQYSKQPQQPKKPQDMKIVLQIASGIFTGVFALLFLLNIPDFFSSLLNIIRSFEYFQIGWFFITVLRFVVELVVTVFLLVSGAVCLLAGFGNKENDGRSFLITYAITRLIVIFVEIISTVICNIYMVFAGYGVESFVSLIIGIIVNIAGVAIFGVAMYVSGQNPVNGINGGNFMQIIKESLNNVFKAAKNFVGGNKPQPAMNQGTMNQNADNQKADNQANMNMNQNTYVNQNHTAGQQNMNISNLPPAPVFRRLKADRNLIVFILLNIVTCGIYGWVFIYNLALDVNVACEGDGRKTPGLLEFVLFSIVTCGIYSYVWYYELANRLQANAPRYGLNFQENGTTFLLWFVFGSLLCGVGYFIALNIIVSNTNKICYGYNAAHGL